MTSSNNMSLIHSHSMWQEPSALAYALVMAQLPLLRQRVPCGLLERPTKVVSVCANRALVVQE